MGNLYVVTAAAGAAALIVSGFFNMYQFYRLVQTDAECRGLKHPKLWGLFSATGNNSAGMLLIYLIRRRKYPVQSMSEEQKEFMGRCKRKIGVGLIFLAAGAMVLVLSMLLSGRF